MSFDHRDIGTSEDDWADVRWAGLPEFDTGAVSGALVVSAHPDDETLGAGGLVALLHRRGIPITFLLATQGEAGHRLDLSDERRAEFATAVARLAPGATIVDGGLPDGALRENAERLDFLVASSLGDADLIVSPWRGDGHRDHRIAGEAAWAVAQRTGAALLEYPVWLWHWGAPDSPEIPWDELVRVSLDEDAQHVKSRAISAYETQLMTVAGEPPVLHDGMITHFARSWETFIRTAP